MEQSLVKTRINHFQSIIAAAHARPAAPAPKLKQSEKQADTKEDEEWKDMPEETILRVMIALRLMILELGVNGEEAGEKLSEIQRMQDGELKSSTLRLRWMALETEQSGVIEVEE